jgi:hypothetical protein
MRKAVVFFVASPSLASVALAGQFNPAKQEERPVKGPLHCRPKAQE